MARRIGVFALVAFLAAGFSGWQKLGAVAASGQHRRKTQQARSPERLQVQPTEDAQQLRQQAEASQHKALEHGYYACCVEPPCSWCMLHIGKCTCALGVGSGRWACRECHGGWEAGQGRIPGKSRADVQKMKTLAVDEKRLTSEPAEQTPPEAASKSSTGKSLGTGAQTVAAGEKLFRKLNCLSCHKMGDMGAAVGPDLTHEAQRQADIAWQIEHLKSPDKVNPGSSMPSFANLKPEELKALAAFLVSRK